MRNSLKTAVFPCLLLLLFICIGPVASQTSSTTDSTTDSTLTSDTTVTDTTPNSEVTPTPSSTTTTATAAPTTASSTAATTAAATTSATATTRATSSTTTTTAGLTPIPCCSPAQIGQILLIIIEILRQEGLLPSLTTMATSTTSTTTKATFPVIPGGPLDQHNRASNNISITQVPLDVAHSASIKKQTGGGVPVEVYSIPGAQNIKFQLDNRSIRILSGTAGFNLETGSKAGPYSDTGSRAGSYSDTGSRAGPFSDTGSRAGPYSDTGSRAGSPIGNTVFNNSLQRNELIAPGTNNLRVETRNNKYRFTMGEISVDVTRETCSQLLQDHRRRSGESKEFTRYYACKLFGDVTNFSQIFGHIKRYCEKQKQARRKKENKGQGKKKRKREKKKGGKLRKGRKRKGKHRNRMGKGKHKKRRGKGNGKGKHKERKNKRKKNKRKKEKRKKVKKGKNNLNGRSNRSFGLADLLG